MEQYTLNIDVPARRKITGMKVGSRQGWTNPTFSRMDIELLRSKSAKDAQIFVKTFKGNRDCNISVNSIYPSFYPHV